MALNLDLVALSDQVSVMRNRINDLVNNLNNGVNTITSIIDETSLPSPVSRTSDLYIIQTHTKTLKPALAVSVDDTWLFDNLDLYPFLSVNYIQEDPINLGTSVVTNSLVYKDFATGKWELADSTDAAKYAGAIVGVDSNIVFTGLFYSTSLSLIPDSKYYCNALGVLTITETDVYVGYSISTNQIVLSGFDSSNKRVSDLETAVGDLETTKLDSVVAGTNISIDNTDPINPIINGLASNAYPDGYIKGVNPTSGSTPTEDILVPIGKCRSSGDTVNIDFTSAIERQYNAKWEEFNPGGSPDIKQKGGTVSTTGTAVTGNTTSFLTDFKVGDTLSDDLTFTNPGRRITEITSNTSMTIESAFGVDLNNNIVLKNGVCINSTVHVFVASNITNDNHNIGFDTDLTGINLLLDNNFDNTDLTVLRRVGSIVTDLNGDLIPLHSNELSGGGIEFRFNERFQVYSANDPIAAPSVSREPFYAYAPSNMNTKLHLYAQGSGTSARVILTSINDTDIATDVNQITIGAATTSDNVDVEIELFTDDIGQVYIRGDGDTFNQLRVQILGYTDQRIN